jgi:hypothetical protein
MNSYENINSDSSENIHADFENAYDLCMTNLKHDDMVNYLKSGNVYQKQFAALNFDKVKDKTDADALMSNLTGCDGKIREAVAYKIKHILINSENDIRELFAEGYGEKFADASIDINANICRLVIDSAAMLKDYSEFSLIYTKKLCSYAVEAIKELQTFEFRDKKYVINKQLFKLYWCLEALSYFYDFADSSLIDFIVTNSYNNAEYTIREKTARLILASGQFENIKTMLQNDENYYVRAVFLNH